MDGNRLIGGRFYDLDNGKYAFILKDGFEKLFNSCEVINCKYTNGGLHSTVEHLKLIDLVVYGASGNILKGGKYTDEYIIDVLRKKLKKVSGAITNQYSKEADIHAEKYYKAIRNSKNRGDVKRISENTGYSIDIIQKIKEYLFLKEHDIDGELKQFSPDFAIASSWQRLSSKNKKDIKEHDLILLKHEILEMEYISKGFDRDKAHILASYKYYYEKASDEYYNKLKGEKK